MPFVLLLFVILLMGNWLFSEVAVAFPFNLLLYLKSMLGWSGLGAVVLLVFWCFGD